jgi:ABC-type Fe3+-hydroxamate transport system substrate-binding protein
MKRSALFAAVALLALAACASDKNTTSGASNSTTSTKAATTTTAKPTKQSAQAFALVRRLGCTNPKLSVTRDRNGLPNPVASVACTAKSVRYRVEVYASHAERVRLLNAASTKLRCGLLKALGGKGPIYSVDGADYSATASGPVGSKDGLAQAKALGKKLGLPVTTTTCPA